MVGPFRSHSQPDLRAKCHEQANAPDRYLVLSPINWCPTEVLQAIFGWSTVEKLGHMHGRLDISFSISRVSRLWRMISIAAPELWNGIILDLNRPRDELDIYWRVITERAKESPMTVVVIPGMKSLRISLPRGFRDVKALLN